MKYLKYLRYIIIHKWYVMKECFRHGLYWRGIVHDMSKFLPGEFIPYAKYFYGSYPKNIAALEQIRGVESAESVKREFDVAWLHHQRRNKHHWQYWILKEDQGNIKVLEMPRKDALEMFCDWVGAGFAITGRREVRDWYDKNKKNINLHDDTRAYIEYLLAQ